jgi:RNA-dependent RNA polymerase
MNDSQFARLHAAKLMIQRIPDLDIISKVPYPATVQPTSYEDWYAPDLMGLDFELRTLIEGLIGTGILRPMDWPRLLEALETATQSRDVMLRVLESLFCEERIHIDDIKATLRRRIKAFKALPYTKEINHVVMIRTIQVTPTRLLIGPPQQEASNTVTRKYSDNLDDIIRVQFVDEGERIHILDYAKAADSIMPGVGLMARIRRALNQGIRVGGKLFFPIASSGSQQKDHSIWFFNPAAIDRTELFRWIGKVNETVVAKYAARMGLPFSTSREVDLRIQIGKREDIEKDGHCFTDGSSVAGTEVMWKAAEALKPNKTIRSRPSAIQFRLG